LAELFQDQVVAEDEILRLALERGLRLKRRQLLLADQLLRQPLGCFGVALSKASTSGCNSSATKGR
jgi:hypothetical protein